MIYIGEYYVYDIYRRSLVTHRRGEQRESQVASEAFYIPIEDKHKDVCF